MATSRFMADQVPRAACVGRHLKLSEPILLPQQKIRLTTPFFSCVARSFKQSRNVNSILTFLVP